MQVLDFSKQGFDGTRQILDILNKYLNEYSLNQKVRQKAIELTSHVYNEEDKATLIQDYVRNIIHFTPSPFGHVYLETPDLLIKNNGGFVDCNSTALLLGSLLRSIGIPAEIVAANLNTNDLELPDHVIINAVINRQEVLMDPFNNTLRYNYTFS